MSHYKNDLLQVTSYLSNEQAGDDGSNQRLVAQSTNKQNHFSKIELTNNLDPNNNLGLRIYADSPKMLFSQIIPEREEFSVSN